MHFRTSYRSITHFAILLLITSLLTGVGLLGGDFWWPDESRHAMDGVYFYDVMNDRPFWNLYRYTELYYAKYPALAFTWYPPFFAIIEAIFYTILGISVATARLTVLFFALLGISLWYLLLQKMFDRELAFFSSLLFITSPVVVGWSRTVMLEIPVVTMIILCVYCFYHYFDLGKKQYAYYLALSICGALYTKQHAAFILPVFLSYILLRKKYGQLIRKECIFSYGILILGLTPLAIFTIKFGTIGVSATIGGLRRSSRPWLPYLRRLPTLILTWPVLILAIIAIILFFIRPKEREKSLLFLLWIGWWYVCFTSVFGIQPYYGTYVVPPFCLLAVLALNMLKDLLKQRLPLIRPILIVGVIGVCIYQSIIACGVDISHAYYIDNVYDEAAKFVVEHPEGTTVMVNAHYDGNFIFHLRKYDVGKKMIALRSDKILVSFAVHKSYGIPSYVSTEGDIYNILRDYGTGYVVIEEPPLGEHKGIRALEMLRGMVLSENFTLVKRLESTQTFRAWFCDPQKRMRDITISIYKYNGMTLPQHEELVIKFPHLRREIRVPLEKLLTEDKKR